MKQVIYIPTFITTGSINSSISKSAHLHIHPCRSFYPSQSMYVSDHMGPTVHRFLDVRRKASISNVVIYRSPHSKHLKRSGYNDGSRLTFLTLITSAYLP